ncbi:hypothetical protein SGUI_0188 [Serinicoccus hydrothermalis]|uniref:AbiEi antitoxin C-terminal domain-containing protein n=2 Tax=Serinicoccus hydrothermalis TaxID=1758689 RepID=A0A1B1N842_9MICO|nr:hypothetical protein SGUI_0188 [Serinicoccus hydrothermalis]
MIVGMDLTLLPDVFRLGEALGTGATRADVDRAIDRGEIRWLRHGWYAKAGPAPPLTEKWEEHRADHLAQLDLELRRRPGHAASHTSGAIVHRFAVSIRPGAEVDLTAVRRAPVSRREPELGLHSAKIETPVEEIDGRLTTTRPRTVADFLRVRTVPHGLALLDAALREGQVTMDEVRRALDTQRRWRGRPRALAVLRLADPLRESWAESYTFGRLHLLGIPMPLHQVDVLDEHQRWMARLDGLWPHVGVAGECDGQSKYFLREPGDDRPLEEVARDRLEAERRRQAPIEELGLPFVRWTPDEVRDQPEAVCARVRGAFAASRPEQFRGYVVYQGEARRLPFSVETPSVDAEDLRYRRRKRRAG